MLFGRRDLRTCAPCQARMSRSWWARSSLLVVGPGSAGAGGWLPPSPSCRRSSSSFVRRRACCAPQSWAPLFSSPGSSGDAGRRCPCCRRRCSCWCWSTPFSRAARASRCRSWRPARSSSSRRRGRVDCPGECRERWRQPSRCPRPHSLRVRPCWSPRSVS